MKAGGGVVVYRRIPRRPLNLPAPVAAIGIFDGVHAGHRLLLEKAVSLARKRHGTAAAVTFYPHPLSVLRPAFAPPLLMTIEQRLQAVSRRGIRFTLVVPFTRAFSKWSPERFVKELLVGRLRVREVLVGRDFRFGKNRRGTAKTLSQLGRKYRFRVHVVPPVRREGVRVSSERLRGWIREGRLGTVRRLMGGPTAVVGRVVRGSGRGAGLGFPTANLRVETGLLPPKGVYAVRAGVGGQVYRGMANLGYRPTFERDGRMGCGRMGKKSNPFSHPPILPSPLLEVHLFGIRRPLYGRRMEVEFLRRLRGERRFPSPAALARQISRDARSARNAFR